MASTVLVRDVLWRVAVLLQDSAPQNQRWPEHELVDWLNDAQMAITKFLPAACSRIDAIKLRPGTLQTIDRILQANCKPGDGSVLSADVLGTQFLRPYCTMGSDGQTPGKAVRMVPGDIMDSQTPDWHAVTGPFVRSVIFDPLTPKYFHVTPGVPSSGTHWLRIGMTAQPIRILNNGTPGNELYQFDGGSSVVISIPDEHTDDLVNYVVARANMKDVEWADAAKANAFTSMFTGSLNAKVQALTGNNPNLSQLPFAPEPLAAAK